MNQADFENITPKSDASARPSKRTFLSAAAAVIPVAAFPSRAFGASPAQVPDPIFAAIDAHATAWAAASKALVAHNELEEELPSHLRQSSETRVVATDDHRWIDGERRVTELIEAETEAARGLVVDAPTTMAGVIALLLYTAKHETRGNAWPDMPDESWSQKLHRNVAAALSGING